MDKKQKIILARIIITALCLALLRFAELPAYPRLAAYIAVYLFIGYDILKEALEGILKKDPFDENFLMAVATLGAFALAIVTGSGDYNEAIFVVLFYQVGEFFEDYAVESAKGNIRSLMDIRPDYANVERGGELEKVPPDTVAVGTVIVVQPGERVPIDGVVTEGESSLNTSALTGESLPRDVEAGSSVMSGSVNLTGVLKIRTTATFGDATVSRILKLVEESGERKARSENFITKFARVYTPAVCGLALALAIVPNVALLIMGRPADWFTWVYRALTALVISCPCALVISIPLSFFAGIGGAGREGILIKGASFLEALSAVDCVVFDKTGTLTKGVFEVNAVHHSPLAREKLLEYAAYAECASSHPIAESIRAAYGRDIDRTRVASVEELSGEGIEAVVDGTKVLAGNARLMKRYGIPYIECHSPGTIVHIALDGNYSGHIVVSDAVKDTSREAISALKRLGVTKTVMLTGDLESTASAVARELGLDGYYSLLLPEGKVRKVEELLKEEKKGRRLAFVGDGINDAPVLIRADIGCAMGAMGSDAAIEASDVVLMDDNPLKIARAIRISRKCLRIVKENIAFSLIVKFCCLALAAFGIAGMDLAVFADTGVMVLAVLNAVRALRTKK